MKRKGRGDGNVHTRGRGVFKHQKQVQGEENVKNADVIKTESALSWILRQSSSAILDVCDDSMGHSLFIHPSEQFHSQDIPRKPEEGCPHTHTPVFKYL